MNREIKFRGKSLKYGNWIFGSLWVVGTKCYIIHEKESEKAGEYSWYDTYITEVLPSTVEQYTGFKDKNGKEIYEGDIVKHRGYNEIQNSVVKFEAGVFIGGYHDESSTKRQLMLPPDKVEVISNVHDSTDKK